MSSLLQEMDARAMRLGVPLSVHLDVTYRCNERCIHCYLPHDDRGEMTLEEIRLVLDDLAGAGVFFLSVSGGDPFVRADCLEILAEARARKFNVKLKTNALLIGEAEAARIFALGVEQVQVSVYSHLAEVHDAITAVRGSFERTIAGVRRLRARGVKVSLSNVLMRENLASHAQVQTLAAELGATYTLDPTVTPHLEGDPSVLAHAVGREELVQIFRTESLVGNVEEFCAPPAPADDDVLNDVPCSAGHTLAYISPYGEVFPCVQLPLSCGNLRKRRFVEIWRESPRLLEVRAIRTRDLPACAPCSFVSTCTRCPGLAYMEGDLRGISKVDCEKSLAKVGQA